MSVSIITTRAVTHLSVRDIASCSNVNSLASKVVSTTLLIFLQVVSFYEILLVKRQRQAEDTARGSSLANSTQ